MSDTATNGSDPSAGRDSTVDGGSGSTAGDDGAEDDGPAGPDGHAISDGGARDVVVPIALYKRVTAYSTLAAVAAVVFGFIMLDAATLQVSLVRRLVTGTLGAFGVVLPETALTALFSVIGLGLIAFGAGVYVLGSRFRAAGMGAENENAQDGDAKE
ncbi:DUF7315 family membrane protein [Halobaculum gomorrense]|uniref:DUF7315 domain-containing protein n=1 Tax=Halobaculum gomorrense TaxID=43928 RepID=A0A1M5KP89_9EURY|nr:hypothetical protein [Halobaculum gomorrense]SHG54578.1 hypothetical protein SAMN05443636_0589 [Halobaculum gomorrense]